MTVGSRHLASPDTCEAFSSVIGGNPGGNSVPGSARKGEVGVCVAVGKGVNDGVIVAVSVGDSVTVTVLVLSKVGPTAAVSVGVDSGGINEQAARLKNRIKVMGI